MKKVVLIILGILALAAVIYFIFFFKAKVTIVPDPNNAQVEINKKVSVGSTKINLLPGTHRLKISLPGYIAFDQDINVKISQVTTFNIKLRPQPKPEGLTNFPANFITDTKDGKSLLYLSNDGKTIFKLDGVLTDKKQTPYAITPDVFSEVQNIIWHPDKTLAIIKHYNGKTDLYDFGRYDLLNQDSFDWGSGIQGIAWRSDGEKIIYYYAPDTGERSLIRTNKDNSEIERLLDMRSYGLNNPKVYWSADQKNVLLVTNQIYIFDVYTKTLKTLEEIKDIKNAQFTPDSQQIIYDKNGSLFTADLEGKNSQELGIKTTLEKITWFDEESFISAFRAAGQNSDGFSRYWLKSGEEASFDYHDEQAVDAKNLIVSLNKDKLFFTSNNQLYLLNLESKKY